jgi:type II secretory pathway pseudopilin PulG
MGEVVESGDRRKRREARDMSRNTGASSLKSQVSDSDGFTLFEIMVVLSITVFLLGFGVSVISKLSYRWGFEANIMRAQAIVRAARNFSLINETFSEVHVIPLENRIFALGEKTVAQWHFEEIIGDEVTGAYGINGKVFNAALVQGKTGQGLKFGTGEGLGVRDSYVDCGNLPVFNTPAGIVFDMWVFPGDFRGDAYKQLIGKLDEEDDEDEEPLDEEALEEEARRRAQNEITLKHKFDNEQRFSIIFKEGSYFLSLTENYALEFGFAVPANYFPLRTLDNVVTPNMWNHIELRYSGIIEYPPDKVRLFVNGVPITVFYIHARGSIYSLKPIAGIPVDDRAQMLPAQLPETDSSLYISDVEESFYGVIDDVRIAAIVDPEIEKLDSAFLMGYPQIIYFDSQGRLDPERHDSDVIVKLTENPLYKAPVPESEKPDFTSRSGGISGPISAEEALSDMERKQGVPELYKHAIVTINKYGKMKLDQVVEEEKKEEE